MTAPLKGLRMPTSRSILGAIAGAVLAILWLVFDGGAVLFVCGLAALGWLIGTVLEKPDYLISLLQRLQDR